MLQALVEEDLCDERARDGVRDAVQERLERLHTGRGALRPDGDGQGDTRPDAEKEHGHLPTQKDEHFINK